MMVQRILFVILLAMLFFKAQIDHETSQRCLDRNTTTTINGFFICIVFLHHFCCYCKPSIRSLMGDLFGQLFVTSFFFYSGYGCVAQFRSKGWKYIRSFPRKRVLSTILKFDFAVCVFAIVALLLGRPLSIQKLLLSFLGWDSIGNSNWYIFAIVFCYVTFFLVFSFSRMLSQRQRAAQCGGVTALALAYILVLTRVKPPWWSDTLMAFPAGVFFGLYADAILGFLQKNYWICWAALIAIFVAFPHCPFLGHRHWIAFNVKSVAFAIVIVMATMRIKVNSSPLFWCGKHLFALYIYQRLPMVIFTTLHPAAFQTKFRWIYFGLSLAISLSIAWLYEKGERTCPKYPS